MSGPVPDTAAFLMRSNCTSQPTSWTLTLTPVCCSNGARIFWVSSTGCGPLFMTHIVTVAPLMLWAGVVDAALVVSELLLFPPHAATTSAIATLATSNMKRRVLLALFMLFPPLLENVYGPNFGGPASDASFWQHLLGAVQPLFPERRLTRHQGNGQGEVRVSFIAGFDPAQQGLCGERAELRLLLADGRERRMGEGGDLDVVEAHHCDVLGHAEP